MSTEKIGDICLTPFISYNLKSVETFRLINVMFIDLKKGTREVPVKYEPKSVDVVTSTADSLKKATEQLTQVAFEMQQHHMKQALFPWTQRQWDCLDVIITLANQCLAVLPSQIVAKTQNRPSQYEVMQKRSRRDGVLRKPSASADGRRPSPARTAARGSAPRGSGRGRSG